MDKNFYISTSIAYVNGAPHLGFAFESIMADSLARYQRMIGNDTFFLTGTDEHGVKIYKTAQEKNISPQELCDTNAEKFQLLTQKLDISNDDFIRTSDQKKHWPSVQKLWQQLKDKGDIYKKSYEGTYCEGCEMFIPEKDLVDGKCPNHQKVPVKIVEENYFFKLSKYSEQILNLIESKQLEIIPEFRQNEILTMLKENGLKDVSFSRPVSTLPWGVPVPDDASQNMYVWCDALTNYISALGYENNNDKYQKYWAQAEKTHVIGKDIVRFHAGIWIGMLLSAEISLPNKVFIHGFLTSEGQKMSKSWGNVVDPFLEIEKYSSDALRYFLLSQVPIGQDYDFTRKQFDNIYNAHLANNLGNLVNRIAVLSVKNNITPDLIANCSGGLTTLFQEQIKSTWQQIQQNMQNYILNKALENIWDLLHFANKQMDELKPWILAKSEPEKLTEIMPLFLELIRQVAFMLEPFLPYTSTQIQTIFNIPAAANFVEKRTWGQVKNWQVLGERKILFERV